MTPCSMVWNIVWPGRIEQSLSIVKFNSWTDVIVPGHLIESVPEKAVIKSNLPVKEKECYTWTEKMNGR